MKPKLFALCLLIPIAMSGCFVSKARKTVRKTRRVVAHVRVAAVAGTQKDYKKAGLHMAMATALAATDVEDVSFFVKAFEMFNSGDHVGAGTVFCRGLVRNKVRNPAIVLGALAAITLVGQRNNLQWKDFLKAMWRQSKSCVLRR